MRPARQPEPPGPPLLPRLAPFAAVLAFAAIAGWLLAGDASPKTGLLLAAMGLLATWMLALALRRSDKALLAQQRELAHNEARLAAFFSQSLMGFFFMMLDEPIDWNDDADKEALLDYAMDHHRITKVNQALLNQYGTQEKDFVGVTVGQLFAHDPQYGRKVWREFFDNGHLFIETSERRMDGTPAYFEGDYVCLYDEQGRITGHFGVQMDVTERKRAEQELLETNRALERATLLANEMAAQAEAANAAKSEFLSNMSHEIRTPLNGVIGITHVLLSTALSERQRRCAEIIKTSGEGLLELINDLLDFSKIEAGRLDIERVDFDLAKLVEDVQTLLSHSASRKSIGLSFSMDPDIPPHLRGDPVRVRQILVNLVGNAIKFTARGGVSVRVAQLPPPPRDEEPTLDAPILLRFDVRDTGIGIPAQKIPLLFHKFSQADSSTTRQFGGTGLGLAISRQLTELMGGAIGVESEPGKGSTFWFQLPFEPAQAPIATEAPAHPPACTVSPDARILLVEDNAINQVVALSLLEMLGLRADVAANGQEALDALARNRYDVVLMDVQMPVMDGFETARRIREIEEDRRRQTGDDGPKPPPSSIQSTVSGLPAPRLPIIAMTAHATDDDRQKCLAAGMNDYLAKPLNPDALGAMLAKWIPACPRPTNEAPAPRPPAPPPRAGAALPFDEEDMLKRIRGSYPLATRLWTLCIQMLPGHLDELDQAMQAGHAQKTAFQLHAIKGIVVNVAAHPLHDIVLNLEAAAKADDLQAVRQGLPALRTEAENLLHAIRERLAKAL
jgi:two-component system, sensor histidine kinase and response regulator